MGENQLFAILEWYVYENDRIEIVGRNGSCKTTLLNVLAERYAQTRFIEQLLKTMKQLKTTEK